MKENPYSSFIEIMKEQGAKNNPPGIKIARVTSISDNDIKIEVDDLVVDKDNIYISDYLLKNYKREIRTDDISDLEGNTNIVNDGGESLDHKHSLVDLKINQAVTYTIDTLEVDDLVAVFPVTDKQTYIILSKVVRYGE